MGFEKVGINLGKEIIAWTRTSGSKSLVAARPIKINTCGLKYCPEKAPQVSKKAIEQTTSSPIIILNEFLLRPKITKILSTNFESQKRALIESFGKDSAIGKKLSTASVATELASMIESHQTNLLMDCGKYKAMVEEVRTTNLNEIKYWQEKYLNSYYKYNESLYKTEHILAQKSVNPKVIKIEKILHDTYGINFINLGDDLKQGKRILKACEKWKTAGEKLPDEIFVSNTIPVALATGQSLRLPNGKTFVLYCNSSNKINNILGSIEYLQDIIKKFIPKKLCAKSTTSKIHVQIHELAHSIQPLGMIKQQIEIPTKYQEIAKTISKYANCSVEELYAELKTLSILNPKKMTTDAWNLLKYLESFK